MGETNGPPDNNRYFRVRPSFRGFPSEPSDLPVLNGLISHLCSSTRRISSHLVCKLGISFGISGE